MKGGIPPNPTPSYNYEAAIAVSCNYAGYPANPSSYNLEKCATNAHPSNTLLYLIENDINNNNEY